MKRWLHHLYEIVMGLLALASVVLAFRSGPWVWWTNLGLWGVFVTDYLVRLLRSEDRGAHFRSRAVELVAIAPYELLEAIPWPALAGTQVGFLRGARLVRVFQAYPRLTRVLRAARGFSWLWRASGTLRGVLRTNHLGHALAITSFLVVAAGVSVCLVAPGEYPRIGDGMWWSLVTAANVGYDTIAPQNGWARLIGAALMLVGIGTVGMITGSIATYFLGHRRATNPHVRHLQEQLDRWDEMTERERRGLAGALRSLAVQADRSPAPRAEASDGAASPAGLGAPLPD